MVSGDKIVCWDRRREIIINEAGVLEKYGVLPSIHPGLACVGRRFGGWLSGHPGLGSQVSFGCAFTLWAYGKNSRQPGEMAGELDQPWSRLQVLRKVWHNDGTKLCFIKSYPLCALMFLMKEKLADLKWQGAYKRL